VEGRKWLQNTYTNRFNVRQRAGEGLRKPLQVRGGGGELPDYGSLVDCIHLNPARAGPVSERQFLAARKRGAI
jgi:hypothetical protein